MIKIAQAYFEKISLKGFSQINESQFLNKLNKETERLRKNFPEQAQNWGAARKAINLFLRDALYNYYLSDHYALRSIEPYLEIPLDKYVAKGLMSLKDTNLPTWQTIKNLNKINSDLYQNAAQKYAESKSTYRVHLDL